MEYSVLETLAQEPVTVAMVRERLRLLPDASESETDLTLTPLITAAREYCENRAGYAFVRQRITAYPGREELLDGAFYLPRPPVAEIESVTAYSDDGEELPLDGWGLVGAEGQIVVPKLMPAGLRRVNPVAVTYVAGAEECPPLAVQAMLLLIGHWYEHRESVAEGSAPAEVPQTTEAILKHYRRWW